MKGTDVKISIVNSATNFFSKYGFSKTTMDEIAKNIHKAKGVLYYYFKSKEELFNEVLKQELYKIKIELGNIVNNENDSLIAIKKYILTRLAMLSKAFNYHETLKADFFEEYTFVKDVRNDFVQFERKQLTLILEKGKNQGYVDILNIESTVNIILMILYGLETSLYLQNKYDEYENTIDELFSMIINSFQTQKK